MQSNRVTAQNMDTEKTTETARFKEMSLLTEFLWISRFMRFVA